MRKYLAIVLSLMLLLTGCGKSQTGPTWQEQYDLGVRYLSEGNYEEAILAFTAAIEIDSKHSDAYIGLADVYAAQGDVEKAVEALNTAIELIGETDELILARNTLIPEEPDLPVASKQTVELKYSDIPELFFMDYDKLETVLDRPIREHTNKYANSITELNSSCVYMDANEDLQKKEYTVMVHGRDYCDLDDLGKGQATSIALNGSNNLMRLYILADSGTSGWMNIDLGDSFDTVLAKLKISAVDIAGSDVVDAIIIKNSENKLVLNHASNDQLTSRVASVNGDPLIRVTFIDEYGEANFVICFEFSNAHLAYVCYESVVDC